MWVVVTLAKGRACARGIEELLKKEGFLVKIKPVYKNVGEEENYYEVRALESEAAEAREILVQNGL